MEKTHTPWRKRHRLLAALGVISLVMPFTVVTSAQSASAESMRHGLQGDYFTMSAPGARDFANHKGTILDPRIDFSDLGGTFRDLTGQSEHTTARWTGQIEVPATDEYTFYAIGDNGFRLWIDDKPVIDHWSEDWDNEQTSQAVSLTAGQRYEFKMELFQDTGGANLFLRWSTPTQGKTIVPDSAFWVPDDFSYFDATATIPPAGDTVRLVGAEAITGEADLAEHLRVSVAGVDWPITAVAKDPADEKVLLITIKFPATKTVSVRLLYDGGGNLAVGSEKAGEFSLPVENLSEHSMVTPFAADVDPNNPLPEYPRPQMARSQWLNLNGQWQFAAAKPSDPVPAGKDLAEMITVPFPIESLLSGIERHEDEMFYRRHVSVPAGWNIGSHNRLLLQFGAVDYESWVYVNGVEVTHHRGGFDAFNADITDEVTGSGPQEIIVRVKDSTNQKNPTGKQLANPSGIFYTPASGIWQTVWLEPVPTAAIDDVVSVPAKSLDSVTVNVKAAKASASASVTVVASDADGNVVAEKTGKPNADMSLSIPDAHLWAPGTPYLYDLKATLTDGASSDQVDSYFGVRSIDIRKIDGSNHIVLNNEKTFLLSTLDQGYWPDGIYTAPTDEALKFDLDEHLVMGFNTVRKHIKVEPARWFYHADQLGLMVWQDMVSAWPENDIAARDAFKAEMHTMIDQHMSSPSVIGWIPFNEGWGEWDRDETGQIADDVKAHDPSRLVNAHSGVNLPWTKGDSGKGDLVDGHDYPGPFIAQPDETRAAMDGEHGGYSLAVPGHMWPGGNLNPYQEVKNSKELTDAYVNNTAKLISPAQCSMSGAVYTQIVDVETELNGLWTYDRALPKVDRDAVREINEKVIASGSSSSETIYPPGKGGLDGTAHWPFDENTGTTVYDRSGEGHHGTTVNDPDWVGGKFGSGLHFDGKNQWVNGGTDVVDTTGNYTISSWVTLDKIPDLFTTIASSDTDTGASAFYLQYSGLLGGFAMSFHGVRALAPMTPDLDTWYHVVGIRDAKNNELRLYINGELAGSVRACGGDLASGSLAIGRGQWDKKGADYWNGNIDEVRTFDRVLSDAEITELFNTVPEEAKIPVVEVAPDAVAPGQILTVLGSNLSAGETVQAVVNPEESLPEPLADMTVDAAGKAQWSWTVPAGYADGVHTVAITTASGVELARTTFTVDSTLVPAVDTPTIEVSPGSVAQGGVLTVAGQKFSPDDTVTITVNSDPVVIATPTADAAGGFSTSWTVPTDFPVGAHTVTATDAQGAVLASTDLMVTEMVQPPAPPTAPPPPGKVPEAGGKMPITGAELLPWLALIVPLLAAGAAGIVFQRRKLKSKI